MKGIHRVLGSVLCLPWMICRWAPTAMAFAPFRGSIGVGVVRVGNPPVTTSQPQPNRKKKKTHRNGWLEDFFEPNKKSSSSSASGDNRRLQYPEQYPATYEPNEAIVAQDQSLPEAQMVRPLLKNTQLESRPLEIAYDANQDGWDPASFHRAVDGLGAQVVLATTSDGTLCGGYNPKGNASLGGARPSVAAFLFYQRQRQQQRDDGKTNTFQKLRKVGGGGLACARDDPGFGISFGPDGLVIGLQQGDGRERLAASKLGPYFERGPEDLPSLFANGATELRDLKVLVGCYDDTEEIPYSGGVLDMTSG